MARDAMWISESGELGSAFFDEGDGDGDGARRGAGGGGGVRLSDVLSRIGVGKAQVTFTKFPETCARYRRNTGLFQEQVLQLA